MIAILIIQLSSAMLTLLTACVQLQKARCENNEPKQDKRLS